MLDKALIENVLSAALTTGGDFSEVFVEDRYTNNMQHQGGKLEKSFSGRDFGIGIRIFKGLQSVYAYTNDFSEEGLLKAAKTAAKALQGNRTVENIILPIEIETVQTAHPIQLMPNSVEKSRKLTVLQNANDIVTNYDASISQAILRLVDEEQNVLIANSEGKFIAFSYFQRQLMLADQ